MKNDRRLYEFYETLSRSEGFSAEILLHEAKVEFRKARYRDLIMSLFALLGRHTAGMMRLRPDMENSWLWRYYRADPVDDGVSGNEAGACRCRDGNAPRQGFPIDARILMAKAGEDRVALERECRRLRRCLVSNGVMGGKPRDGTGCILGSS